MTDEQREMMAVAATIERAKVPFAWLDNDGDPMIVFDHWTVEDIQKQYREHDRDHYIEARAFTTRMFGHKPPKPDLDNLWQEMRRCAWAMNEIGMHFWLNHTPQELEVYGAMVREFQSATRTAITRYVHAVGDRPEAWKNVRVFCLDWHRENERRRMAN